MIVEFTVRNYRCLSNLLLEITDACRIYCQKLQMLVESTVRNYRCLSNLLLEITHACRIYCQKLQMLVESTVRNYKCLSNLLLETRHQIKSKNQKVIYQQIIIYQNLMNTHYLFYKNTKMLVIFALLFFLWSFYTLGKIFSWLYFVQLLMKNQLINYLQMQSLHRWSLD